MIKIISNDQKMLQKFWQVMHLEEATVFSENPTSVTVKIYRLSLSLIRVVLNNSATACKHFFQLAVASTSGFFTAVSNFTNFIFSLILLE